MIFQIIIKFRRHRAQLRQIVPWDRRQIVVLVVITHVQRHPINGSVVAESLLVEIVSVMLLDPPSAHWMQPNREEKCEYEIKKSRPTAKINNSHIVGGRAHKIDEKPAVPHLDRFQSRWTCHLKKWEKHKPNRFPVPFVAHQAGFPLVRQIGVVFVIALMRVML